jgi:putative membrane protein
MVLGLVPLAIPVSWFALGLTSYMLASRVLGAVAGHVRGWGIVALGAWFLTVWDLVLDPAMAHESLPVKFWIWHRTGPYFGMPVQNFIGWALTGALFMAVSRALWGSEPEVRRIPAWFPLAVYCVNMVFAVALSISVGLWLPVLLALVLGVLPSFLALAPQGWGARQGTAVPLAARFAGQRNADAS